MPREQAGKIVAMEPAVEEAVDQMVRVQLEARGIRDPRVLEAMRSVPRHHFAPDLSIADAYSDHARPTAEGQTISQPYIVGADDRVAGG